MWHRNLSIEPLMQNSNGRTEENESSPEQSGTNIDRSCIDKSFLSPLALRQLFATPKETTESDHELSSILVDPSSLSVSPCVFTPSCSTLYNFPRSSQKSSPTPKTCRNISSGDHVYAVVNKTPGNTIPSPLAFEDGFEACLEVSSKSPLSTMTSNSCGPICRICHEGDGKENFISPCYCSGSMKQVHKSCLEKWLSTSNDVRCELCHYSFPIRRVPGSFLGFISIHNELTNKGVLGDIICVGLLTPFIIAAAYMCIAGVLGYQQWPDVPTNETLYADGPRSQLHLARLNTSNRLGILYNVTNPKIKRQPLRPEEVFGLILLTVVLLVVYLGWVVLTIMFHYRQWKKWRLEHQKVILLET